MWSRPICATRGAVIEARRRAPGPRGLLGVLIVLGGCDSHRTAASDPATEVDAAVPPGLCDFLVCDDGDPCTADACRADVGCVHTPAPAPGCGPACVPVARPLGLLSPPGRGVGRAMHGPPGYISIPADPG